MPWTTEQTIFIAEEYFRQKSIHAAQLQFKERFGCREFPVHSVIYRWVNKFRTHGTVHNLNLKDTNRQSHSGRPKSSRTPHNVAAVRDSVVHSPSRSVRRRSGLWQSTLRDMSRCLESSGQHLVDGEGSSGSSSGSSRMVPSPTPQRNHWHGYNNVTLTDWSAAGVTRSGLRIHRTWTPQIFICGDTLRTGCMTTTPRLSLIWIQQSQLQ